jgi:beta-glucanase (GH16 family)
VTGAEIDVAEYFGDGRADGGLSSYVHYNGADGELSSSGGNQPKARRIIGEGKSPADGWHVYSVEWSPDGYVFRLDGVPTLRTSKPHVASAPEIMVLSLLTSDWELPNLKSTRSIMQVDWVRVWQE